METIYASGKDHGLVDNDDNGGHPMAPFSDLWRDLELAIAPNGAYAVFASNRPHPGQTDSWHATYFGQAQSGGNFRKIDLESGNFVHHPLPPSVNDGNSVWTPSISGNNNLYFMKTTPSGRFRLHIARYNGGKYQHVDAPRVLITMLTPRSTRMKNFLSSARIVAHQ